MARLQVGDHVVLSSCYQSCGDAASGPLSPGVVGEVVEVDGSDRPYRVRLGTKTHWYRAGALVRRGLKVTAYEVDFDHRTWWYPEQALKKHPSSDTPQQAGLRIGDFAVLSDDYQKFPDAVKGPLCPGGAAGQIVACHVEVDGRTFWYDKPDPKVLAGHMETCGPDLPQAQLSVGDKVVLSSDFRSFPGVENGPLAEGDVGTVVECDQSHLPYKVEFGSSTYWYPAGALEKHGATPDTKANRSGDKVNDEGATVFLGNNRLGVDGSSLWYCGRHLGTDAIPGSDGRCGPDSGPQCASCRRFQTGQEAKTVCPQGHPLVAFLTPNGTFRCDSDACRGKARNPEGTKMYGCRRCNYDLCVECMGKAQASSVRIQVGDSVRVSPSVKSPAYGWGSVNHSMVGIVVREDGDSLVVDFPSSKGWHAKRDEMEKVASGQQAWSTLREQRIGVRVRRGPDWDWGEQDGGAGKLGTTVEGSTVPGWVRVQWDAGGSNSYRVGSSGKYDLCVEGAPEAENVQGTDGEVRIEVTGAGGAGARCNGVYKKVRDHNGLPLFKQVDGKAIIYHSTYWKMNFDDRTSGWYYSIQGGGPLPPSGRWTTQGYGAGDADPPPIVSVQKAPAPASPPPPPAPSVPTGAASASPAGVELRIVVSGCQASKLNGTYVRKDDRKWNGKPLYQHQNEEGLFLYWTNRPGQKEGWNLGPGDTTSWVYYAPGGSDTMPPTTGWTAKDSSTSGLPTVRFNGGQVNGDQAQRNNGGEVRTCPQGHTLQPYTTPGGICDQCRRRVSAGEKVMDCRRCNWYLCDSCYPQGAKVQANGDGPAPTSCKAGESYRFVPTSSYKYDSRCIKGEVVEVLSVVGGSPPVHVKWPGGFTYFVHYEDLRAIVSPAAKTVCPQGHPLVGFTTNGHYLCGSDACRGKASKPKGAQMYACRRCEYDLCAECMDKAQEQERAKPPPPRNSAPQVLKRKEVGLRVRRGPDWKWGDQDGGEGKLGTTCEQKEEGWITVRWDHGGENGYRVGKDGKYDLVLAEDEAAAAAAAPARNDAAATPLPEGWVEYTDPASGNPYYHNASTNTSVWERPQAADKSADTKELRIHVQGAGGRGRGCNGIYKQVRMHDGHPLFKKVDGEAVIYWAGWWKMADDGETRGWFYRMDGDGQLPPEGRWTTKGAEGLGADPPPIVSIEGSAVKLNNSAASTAAIKVGDSVRVSETVSEPAYGWGRVKHKMVGVVVKDSGQDVEVDFPEQKGWTGKRSELEKVGGNDQPEEAADPNSVNVGDWVRVSESVSEPHYGWGDVKHKMFGIVVKEQGDDLKVDFPEHKGWTGKRSELERVTANDAPVQESPIRVGDLVRVSQKVSEPRYGWGGVKPTMVGRVSKEEGDIVQVDFPTHSGWSGKRSELEKLAGGGGETAPAESCAVAPLVVGDEVVLVSAYKLFGDAASGPLSPGDRGKIESTSGCRFKVSFNERTWWYDPAALRRPGDLVVQADTPSSAIKVGDQVRVSPSVKEPKYHWGGVKHGMVGVVTVDEGDSLRVRFPGIPRWHAKRDEMEKVVPDEQAKATPVCPQGHPLAAFLTTGACICKAAACRGKAQRPKGEKMHSCRPCSYDLCQECFAQAGKGGAVPTSAQVGEKYMFVRTSNHNYVGRCASNEVVEVVEVAEADAASPLPVLVKWPGGFTHGAHYEDLRHLDGLPLQGDKVLETCVKEHFYWAFCGGGVIRDVGREFLKVDRDLAPATGSTGPARVVVSECADWSYDGVYVLKEDKEWRGKPLYVKDGVEDKFCYWADRDEDGLGQGWNLGTNNTKEGWAYFAKTTSETPPSTGWTPKDSNTPGLPKVSFIPGSSMVTKGVRALGALPDDAAWQVEFTDVGSHWAAGVATVEAPLSGSAYLLGDEDVRDSWAACFDKSGKALARHRGLERELKDYKDIQPSLPSGLSGALPGKLAGLFSELGDLQEKLGLKERGAPFELKFWRRNGRTLVVQLPGESKERVLFTNLSSQPLYAVAATAKVGSTIRLKGLDSQVKVAQPESEDESEAWCSSPSPSCGEDDKEKRAKKKLEIAKLRRAAAKRRKEERRKAEAEAARKAVEGAFRTSTSAGKEKRNVNGEAEVQEKAEANANRQAEAMQNANHGEGDAEETQNLNKEAEETQNLNKEAEETQNLNGEAEETQNLNGEAEAGTTKILNDSGGQNLKKALTIDARLGEAHEPFDEQVNSKLSTTATPAMFEELREAALKMENHEGPLAKQESKLEKEEALLDLTCEEEEAPVQE